ncbi:MAG TPA: peptidase M28, partial [Terriglobales bacterium]|nr:peptidase M28 [Terriglobales bacterium]
MKGKTPVICIILTVCLTVFAAEKKTNTSTDTSKPSYELPQPAKENLDLTMYQEIRDEGLHHSHVMEYASALMDGIGPRLTGSPNLKKANEWTREQFAAMGCSNAHLEDWGEFGMGWQQINTWVRMASPDTAVFIAQAAPWSPSTNGTIKAPAISMEVSKEEDLNKFKGKLAGRIVLLGEMREVKPVDKPLFKRLDEKDLARIAEYPVKPEHEFDEMEYFKKQELRAKVAGF